MELVSIVVPIYKVEKYLDKCIQSIREQTYENLEIILVDDGSPDDCGRMCDEYAEKDSRIQVVHKENGGLSDARNEGVRHATGKYLLFVDSDDYISKELVEKTVEAAEQNRCDMVLFDYFYVESGKQERRTCEVPSDRVLHLEKEKTLFTAPPAAWSKLFNRKFYLESGITFPKGLYFEDLGTTPKFMLKAERIFYLKEPLYYYMIRSNSIMGNKNYEKKFHDMVTILDQVMEYYREEKAFEKYKAELGYLVFANAFFEPAKELVLEHAEKKYLEKYRQYAYARFPDLERNKYVEQLRGKDRLHFLLLKTRQYWMMRMLSRCRKMAAGITER